MWSIRRAMPRPVPGQGPLFVQIAEAITSDIRRGVLRAGDRVPSTRAIASELGVNRNTVVAAFDELMAQGWLESDGARGSRVAAGMLTTARATARPKRAVRTPVQAEPGFALRPVDEPRTLPDDGVEFQMSVGGPDTRLFPSALLARAYRRVLARRTGHEALDYGAAYGTPRLRAAIAEYLRGRGMAVGPEHILITRGSQQALDLAARLLVRPGDVAAVEELGYQPAWRALGEAGAGLASVPLDGAGLVVDALPAARCLYTTPHHQYPTTVLLSPARRLALLAHARRHRMAIIEDDYDHEFHFDGRPVPPLAADDAGGNVIYVGTLSKVLVPGLRLGFAAAPVPVIEALARLRASTDRQGDHVLELAIAELIEDGTVARHARKMRRVYAGRRDALVHALRRELGGAIDVSLPPGGITLWARVAPDITMTRWKARALERGVQLLFAQSFALDGKPRPYLRLGFAHHDERELVEAVRRMARALSRR